jgi:hypothetical protein
LLERLGVLLQLALIHINQRKQLALRGLEDDAVLGDAIRVSELVGLGEEKLEKDAQSFEQGVFRVVGLAPD